MLALSATEAITPALSRTRRLLFQPFRWGTYLKLCAVAVITEGFSGNSNFSHHNGPSPHVGSEIPFHVSPEIIAFIVAAAIVCIIIGIVVLYLTVRLRFALFNCLIHQSTAIAPGWRMYREQAWRFFVMSIVVAIGYLAVVAASVVPFVKGFLQLYRESKLNGHIDVPVAFALVLQIVPVVLVLILLAMAINVVLRDFMLPHIALENASAGEALEAAWHRISDEIGTFILYAFLRIVLPVVAMIGMMIVLLIPMIIIFGVPGVMIAGLHSLTVHGSPAVVFVATFFEVLLGLLMLAIGVLAAICFGGPLSIAIRNYALVFYGGRYEPLGKVLFPPLEVNQGHA
jgi:hypothetical protein